MAEWVYVENNQIIEYHGALPKSWRNISGLDKASVDYLKTIGWFKVEKNHPSFDPETQKSEGYSYQIFSDHVLETLEIVSLTQEEINVRDQNRTEQFNSYLREERNRRLLESDWTQLIDVQNIRSQQWKDSWVEYRQELRDLPSLYQGNNYDTSIIVWPVKPTEE